MSDNVVYLKDFKPKKEEKKTKIIPPGYEVPAGFNLATTLGLDRTPSWPPADMLPPSDTE